ncbi:MAG TPA: GDSL-type esterase/lipase family protein [archaeon]|nr:GDSL-type esterase/lipase family protein [archaeon]
MSIVLIFGDSITYGAFDTENSGWAGRLRNYLDEGSSEVFFITYNLGVSGDNSSELLKRFESECESRINDRLEEGESAYIIFSIGINDSQCLNMEKKLRAPEKQFELNIQKLIELAKKFTSKIMFVGLAPVDEDRTVPIPWDTNKSYKNSNVKKYDQMIQDVCARNKIPFVEIFDKLSKLNFKDLLYDGLHPNTKGHEKIFEIVKNSIEEYFLE